MPQTQAPSSAFLGSGPPSGIPCCSLLTLEAIFEIDESERRSKYGGYIGLRQTFSACWGLGSLVSGAECQGTWVRITKSGIAPTGDSGRTRRGTETGDQGTMDVDADAGADVRTVDVGAGADADARTNNKPAAKGEVTQFAPCVAVERPDQSQTATRRMAGQTR